MTSNMMEKAAVFAEALGVKLVKTPMGIGVVAGDAPDGFMDAIEGKENFRAMQEKVHELAVSKGWWEGTLKGASGPRETRMGANDFGAKIALIHSEVSEALECARGGAFYMGYEDSGKPCGLPSELADIVIRTMDIAEAMGIDLWDAIEKKHEYNKTRSHRHGGKAL